MKSMQSQQGFTLIELIVVIVILGILAATAMPKFVDMAGEAGDGSAQGVAGALSSAASINYAQRAASNGARGVDIKSGTATCASLLPLMTGGALPAEVEFVSGTTVITCADPAGSGGISTACMVKHTKGATAAGFAVTTICTS